MWRGFVSLALAQTIATACGRTTPRARRYLVVAANEPSALTVQSAVAGPLPPVRDAARVHIEAVAIRKMPRDRDHVRPTAVGGVLLADSRSGEVGAFAPGRNAFGMGTLFPALAFGVYVHPLPPCPSSPRVSWPEASPRRTTEIRPSSSIRQWGWRFTSSDATNALDDGRDPTRSWPWPREPSTPVASTIPTCGYAAGGSSEVTFRSTSRATRGGETPPVRRPLPSPDQRRDRSEVSWR